MTHENGVILYCPGLHVLNSGKKDERLQAFAASQGWGFQPVVWPLHAEGQAREGFTFRMALGAVRKAMATVHAKHDPRTRIVLAGTSFGGWVAAWMAVTCPGAVQGLLLLNPSFNFVGATLRRQLKLELLARMAWVWYGWVRPFRYHIRKGDGSVALHSMPMSLVRDVGMDGYDPIPFAGRVMCPVLAVVATEGEGFLSSPRLTGNFMGRAGGRFMEDPAFGHGGNGQASAETVAAIQHLLSDCNR